MGCIHSRADGAQTEGTTKYLTQDKLSFEQEFKLLLLGAGESGKSTVAKQMKILFLNGFTKDERRTYSSIIFNNTLVSIKALAVMAHELKIPLQNQDLADKMRRFEVQYFSGKMDVELGAMVKELWADKGIKEVYKRQNEFQLNDSAAYYLDAIDRLMKSDYVPTEEDVLKSRANTTGVIETEFRISKTEFKVVDIGGRRSERKKWMHCFQDVSAVVFVTAISEYDLKLYEDDATLRMHESLKLFKEIVNTQLFSGEKGKYADIIIFFNKADLFRKKIQNIDLNVCFPEYTGGCDFDNAYQFIENKFLECNENPNRHIYTHLTCATDTENIAFVFQAVRQIQVQNLSLL